MKLKGLMTLLLMASMVPASATIARLKALGMDETDNEGSYFIKDDRNVFLNAANVNDYGDTVILEWGSECNALAAQTRTDADHNPKAKGGVFKKNGNMTYGVYLGNESNTSALLRTVASSTTTLLDGADNQLDLFVGGKAGFGDWGASFVFTQDHFNDGTNRGKDIAHAVKLGAKSDKWHALANISTGTYVERVNSGTVNYFDGKMGFHLGGGYEVHDGGTVYGFIKKFDWEQYALAFDPDKIDGGFTTWTLGYGVEKNAGKGTFFSSVEYRFKEISADYTTKVEAKNVFIPVMVGYEYNATSWLTLRGSVTQRVWGYRNNNNYGQLNAVAQAVAAAEFGANTSGKDVTFDNTTDVRAGATLNFGKVKVDGLLGLGRNDGTINSSSTERGALDLDRLMARVGMVYSF